MMELIRMMAWLEFIRLKNRIGLLVILIPAATLVFVKCDSFFGVTDLASSMTDFGQPDGPAEGFRMFESVPVLFSSVILLFLGFFVIISLPFRDKDEWENGQYQMLAMGQFSFRQIQLTRLIVYVLVGMAYFCVVILGSLAFVHLTYDIPGELVVSLGALCGFYWMVGVPMVLSVVLMLMAINTAYYRDGQGKVLSFVKIIGALEFVFLITFLMETAIKRGFQVIPSFDLEFKLDEVGGAEYLPINPDLLVVSLLISGVFILWSALVLEQVEA